MGMNQGGSEGLKAQLAFGRLICPVAIIVALELDC